MIEMIAAFIVNTHGDVKVNTSTAVNDPANKITIGVSLGLTNTFLPGIALKFDYNQPLTNMSLSLDNVKIKAETVLGKF